MNEIAAESVNLRVQFVVGYLELTNVNDSIIRRPYPRAAVFALAMLVFGGSQARIWFDTNQCRTWRLQSQRS